VVKPLISGKQEELVINIGRIPQLNIYQITEDELQTLENGGSDPIYLNFAIFTISTAIAFLITLLTIQIDSTRLFVIFLVVTILGLSLGLVLLTLWWRSRKSIKRLVNKIKERIHEK